MLGRFDEAVRVQVVLGFETTKLLSDVARRAYTAGGEDRLSYAVLVLLGMW